MADAAVARHPPGLWLVAASLLVLAVLCWYGLVVAPMPMPEAGGVRAPAYVLLTFLMWLVMMVAMMTPSVAPAVLLLHRVQRGSAVRTGAFVLGYFVTWSGFSLLATLLQVALIEAGWIDTMGAATSRWTSAALLLSAAGWQWLPAKAACLHQCRSPAEFIAARHRPGVRGVLIMGMEHGALCVGCCWALMLLLFVGGVMNLAWIAGLTLVAMLEKLAPGGTTVRRVLALGLVVAGLAVLLGATPG